MALQSVQPEVRRTATEASRKGLGLGSWRDCALHLGRDAELVGVLGDGGFDGGE
jgi:hypothetical protein